MTVVVLGWDGLDYDLLERWDMAESFGETTHRLRTYKNPSLEKPHTYEVWPTMITGKMPIEHGIHADDYIGEGAWSNPILNLATAASKYTVPESIRWRVGRMIRARGATFAFETLDYYPENGIRTIFHGPYDCFPLGIPNARSEYDDLLGIEMDRGAALAEFMDIDTDAAGDTVHRPSVDIEQFAMRLESSVGRKLSATRAAIQWQYDLVFVWLGYLDTVGHVGPTLSDPEAWVRSGYETAADWTEFVHDSLTDDDTLICVSDHGLKDGAHTMDAFFGWWGRDGAEPPLSVQDVPTAIVQSLDPPNRRNDAHSASESTDDFDEVADRLLELGYL